MTSALPTIRPARTIPDRPETLTEQAYYLLEEMIVTLTLAPASA